MQYWVDGYNLLFRLDPALLQPTCSRRPLEAKRRSIIQQLSEVTELLGLRIILVFDGAEENIPYATRHFQDGLEIVYTIKNQTADLYLLDIATRNKKSPLTIVTSDRALAKQCRHVGAKTLELESFLIVLNQKLKAQSVRSHKKKDTRTTSRDFNRYLAIFEERLFGKSHESD